MERIYLSKDEHDASYYEKILKSYILVVIQGLYFYVHLCVKHQPPLSQTHSSGSCLTAVFAAQVYYERAEVCVLQMCLCYQSQKKKH